MRFAPIWAALASLAIPTLAQQPPVREVHRLIPSAWGTNLLDDFDGNGAMDLVVSGQELFLGDGRGGFAQVPDPFPPLTGLYVTQAAGDIDGDGDVDLIRVDQTLCFHEPCPPDELRLFENVGSGVFIETALGVQVGQSDVVQLFLADLDGSPGLDLYVTTRPSCYLQGCYEGQDKLFLNDGAGNFTDVSATHLPTAPTYADEALLGDLDLDGDLDLVVFDRSWIVPLSSDLPGVDRLLINDGSGVFTHMPGALPIDAQVPWPPTLFDADLDLDLDILISHNGATQLLLNDGTGFFQDAGPVLPPAAVAQAAPIDLELDGDLDLLVHIWGNSVRLYRNGGAGQFADEGPAGPFQHGDVQVADFDLDGDSDALVAASFTHGLRLLLNNGQGGLVDLTSDLPLTTSLVSGLDMGDLDGDGDLDVVSVGDPGPFEIQRNDGHGSFTPGPASSLGSGPGTESQVRLGDLDGDGDLDAFTAAYFFFSSNPDQGAVHINDGTGTFSLSQSYDIDGPIWAIGAADLDLDGDLDAVYARFGPQALWLNDGQGLMSDASSQLPASTGNSRALGLGDVDGDGDPDLVLGNVDTNELYLGDGSGGFADASSSLPAQAVWTQAVALGDKDNDGDLDLFFGSNQDPELPDQLLENDGAGSFVDVSGLLPGALTRTLDAAFVDLDVDGLRDLFLAEWEGSVPSPDRVLLNRGAQGFEAFVLPSSASSRALAVGDIDSDGDEDVYVGNYGVASVYRSLRRQLAERRPSSVGKDLRLELFGGPAEPWILFLAGAQASIPLPGLGTLYLDPGTLQLAGAGSFDGQGRAEFAAPIPAQPNLLGKRVYFEALSGTPLQLGNLERVRLTNL